MAGDYWNPVPYQPNYTYIWPPQDARVDDLVKRVAELEAEVGAMRERTLVEWADDLMPIIVERIRRAVQRGIRCQ